MSKANKTAVARLNLALSSTTARLIETVKSLEEKIEGWNDEARFHEDQAQKVAVQLADLLLTNQTPPPLIVRRYQKHCGRVKMALRYAAQLNELMAELNVTKNQTAAAVLP